ncbi:conjugative transposon protein TraM [Pedobacter fastidiosus]|uniref:Conjugative transposon protein TraM n=1 Tax=Pedobacter fastidiosus TaxID=2765361 RepID=A0ABR7KWK8_9SPHI|nr:conjugative transposon protein TraM [Pedobacter fastidiosus]MBC6112496.1 conjugative transposon protein TraM [Pedobacter fastidiosus]
MESELKRDRRKILLVLPMLILPFMALAFYALGGGRDHSGVAIKKGLNTSLPNANFKKDEPRDKMEFYQQTERDSGSKTSEVSSIADRLGFRREESVEKTKAIEEKLSLLERELARPQDAQQSLSRSRPIQVPGMKGDVDRLEVLMKNMQQGKGEDEEMKQLTGMLEKVLDIQHPQRVKDSYLKQVNTAPDSIFKAIGATIPGKQKVVQGSTLKLVFQDSVVIGEQSFPKGQEVFGIVNLTNQRLLLDIKTIRVGKQIIPVDLSIYGLDGIRGLNAPEAVVSAAISGGADDAVRSLQLMGMDASVGTQVAGAGIDAAKSLFSKKVKRVKVKIPEGMSVLLRNNALR